MEQSNESETHMEAQWVDYDWETNIQVETYYQNHLQTNNESLVGRKIQINQSEYSYLIDFSSNEHNGVMIQTNLDTNTSRRIKRDFKRDKDESEMTIDELMDRKIPDNFILFGLDHEDEVKVRMDEIMHEWNLEYTFLLQMRRDSRRTAPLNILFHGVEELCREHHLQIVRKEPNLEENSCLVCIPMPRSIESDMTQLLDDKVIEVNKSWFRSIQKKPDYWDVSRTNKNKIMYLGSDCRLFSVDHMSKEYVDVFNKGKQVFYRQANIKKMFRVQNHILWDNYINSKIQLSQDSKCDYHPNEQWMWFLHPSSSYSSQDPLNICEVGFEPPPSNKIKEENEEEMMKNEIEKRWGDEEGFYYYFCKDPLFSLSFAHKKNSIKEKPETENEKEQKQNEEEDVEKEERWIILCKVLLGKVENVAPQNNSIIDHISDGDNDDQKENEKQNEIEEEEDDASTSQSISKEKEEYGEFHSKKGTEKTHLLLPCDNEIKPMSFYMVDFCKDHSLQQEKEQLTHIHILNNSSLIYPCYLINFIPK